MVVACHSDSHASQEFEKGLNTVEVLLRNEFENYMTFSRGLRSSGNL